MTYSILGLAMCALALVACGNDHQHSSGDDRDAIIKAKTAVQVVRNWSTQIRDPASQSDDLSSVVSPIKCALRKPLKVGRDRFFRQPSSLSRLNVRFI